MQRITGRAEEVADIEALDPALKQALGDFKASVHAWSEAAYNRPRTVREVVVRRTRRVAAGWSLASILFAGTISGALYEHHQREVQARLAAAQAAEHQREIAAQRARDEAQQDEEVLASVDTAISREVPSAMEPLAALTDETETR
jgi:hypothetical protein